MKINELSIGTRHHLHFPIYYGYGDYAHDRH